MKLKNYFEPFSYKENEYFDFLPKDSILGKNVYFFSEKDNYINLENYDLVIFGVEENRNSKNKFCKIAPNFVRKKLYSMSKINENMKIIDLGNFKTGKTIKDTYFGISYILEKILEKNVIPILIGGSIDLVFANFIGYKNIKKNINIASVDSNLNILNENNFSFLKEIFKSKEPNLFHFLNLSYQNYFVSEEELNWIEENNFECLRMGKIRENIKDTEIFIRDIDIFNVNLSAVRLSDSPSNFLSSPNGLYAEEICQIAKYAGMSDNISSFGIYETGIKSDDNFQSSHLTAQIIWHFIEGFYWRKADFPNKETENYEKFILNLNSEIFTFYKSRITERWWLEFFYNDKNERKKFILSVSHQDYINVLNGNLPERWLKFYKKFL